jgi:N-acetylmuramoyl-L-alanine amidase
MRCWIIAASFAACFGSAAQSRSCSDDPLRVAVDIGHSRVVSGADSARGKAEYDFNKRYALELLQLQKKWTGLSLFLLEKTGEALTLHDRPRLAGRSNAEVFLSIHHDSVTQKYISHWQYDGRVHEYSDVFSGFSLFVYRNENFAQSYKLANAIGEMMTKIGLKPTLHHAEPIHGEGRQLLNPDLGVYAAPFLVLRSATMPAVLFEVGIIANRQEEERLEDPAQRASSQSALLRALQDYCFTS